MKPQVREPRPPLPLFTQREDGVRQEKAFACGECGSVYSSTDSAIYCCKQSTCEVCGTDVSKGWMKCSPCRDKIMWDNAEEIIDFKGPVYDHDHDKWFEDMDAALDSFADDEPEEIPEFLQPCDQTPFQGVSIDDVIQNICEEMFEDADEHLVGVDELEKAINEFNKANAHLKSWWADPKKKIRVLQDKD